MKKLLMIMAVGMVFAKSVVYAGTYVKLVSDQNESNVYVNGEIAGTYYDIPLEFILPPGDHLIEVKKEHDDGSFDYFKRNLKAGNLDVKVSISAELKREYSEDYYFKHANTMAGAQAYLEKHPKGRYYQKVLALLETAYAQKATTLETAKAYFEKYPQGRYKEAILNREIYLVSLKKEDQPDGITTHRYQYDAHGNLAEDYEESSDNAWRKNSYSYNGKMQLVKKVMENKGQGPKKATYAYDATGRLIEECIYDLTALTQRTRYGYDAGGNLSEAVKERYINGKSVSTDTLTYGYDDRKNLIEQVKKRLNDDAWEKDTYTYDDKGNQLTRRVQKEGYRHFDETYYYDPPDISYTRDDTGKIREETKRAKSGGVLAKTTYHYGENGTLVQKNTIFANGRQGWSVYDAHENLVENYFSPDSQGKTDRTSWEYKGVKLKDLYH